MSGMTTRVVLFLTEKLDSFSTDVLHRRNRGNLASYRFFFKMFRDTKILYLKDGGPSDAKTMKNGSVVSVYMQRLIFLKKKCRKSSKNSLIFGIFE